MKAKTFVVIVTGILILSICTVLLPIKICKASQDTVYVDDDFNENTPGWGVTMFNSVQQGINHVLPDGIVHVASGQYTEDVFINKSLSLIGDGWETTTITRRASPDSTIWVYRGDHVTISGFTLTGALSSPQGGNAGLELSYTNYSDISNNYITGNFFGISMGVTRNCTIAHNIISNNPYGAIEGQNAGYDVFEANSLSAPNTQALYLNYAENCIFRSNLFSDSYGGICIVSLTNSRITNNIINTSQESAIRLTNSNNNIIDNNTLNNNLGGISLFASFNNYLIDNNIYKAQLGNGLGIGLNNGAINNIIKNNYIRHYDRGFWINDDAHNNLIYNNYIEDCTYGGWDPNKNIWNITKTSGTNIIGGSYLGGNYWNSYTGVDMDGDGLGDVPFNIIAGTNQDKHPLCTTNYKPHAEIECLNSGLINNVITFNASLSSDSDGNIISYQWYFGDSHTSSGITTSHSFSASGTYTITLTVTDNDEASDIATAHISISPGSGQNIPPVANAGGIYQGYINNPITFHGSGSYDTDGSIVSYNWNFGDGHIGTGQTTTHSYPSPSIYTVTLTVTDDDGATNTATTYVGISQTQVQHFHPIAYGGGPYLGIANQMMTFDGALSADIDGTITSYWWNFGDGQSGAGRTITHTYLAAGTYTVSLTVTDNDGLTNSSTTRAIISAAQQTGEDHSTNQTGENQTTNQTAHNIPPVAIHGGPYSGSINREISFDGLGSYDQDGMIETYGWNFGDNTTGYGQAVTHSYAQPGNYTITFWVIDNNQTTTYAHTYANISPSTPGFEFIFVLSAIVATVLLLRRKR